LLLTRTLSAVVLAPLVLLAIWFGGWAFAALVVLAAGLMGWEWARMCNGGQLGWRGIAVIATLVAAAAVFLLATDVPALGVLLGGAVVATSLNRATLASSDPAARSKRAAMQLFLLIGTAYIGIGCLAFLWLRTVPADARDLVFWVLAVVWATDIGAYFAGRGIGGPKLAPRISPNKTWAGLIGGALAAGLVGVVAAGLIGRDTLLLVAGGMVLAVIAQGGDLLESWCKRRFGVKDSSHIIPGHGGILDRVDGLLAVLPVVFLYLWVMGEAV
jgi:phosphatidate cytidylyltransferase